MANNRRVLDSIKDFLLKMKACDEAIPEELAEDACEMVEEVKDALNEEELEVKDEDEVIEEVKENDACKDEDIEKKIEDAMNKVLRKNGLIKDSCMKDLDEVEEKLEEKVGDEENIESEEEVTVDPEKINDAANLKILRSIKPVIANVKDASSRRALSKAFATIMNSNRKTADYSSIYKASVSNAKDSYENIGKNKNIGSDDYGFGMEIAKKYNPHYKEEK